MQKFLANLKLNNRSSQPRYYLLATAICALGITYPILGLGNIGLLIWTSIFWLVLLTAVRATCYPKLVKRTLMILGIIIVAIGIAGVFCYYYTGNTHVWVFPMVNSITCAFLIFLTGSVLYGILISPKISTSHLVGASTSYILIGVTYAYGYIVLHSITGQSLLKKEFITPEIKNSELASQVADYGYFSFSTLTTLGFGDLTPLTLASRVLASSEAITGQLFLTVLIARLVSLHVTNSKQSSNN